MSNLMSADEFTKRFHKSIIEIADEDTEYTFKTNHVSTGKPTASGLGSCARKQWYSLTNTPPTEPPGLPWASMMGFAGEAIVRETLYNMGYTVEHAKLPTTLPFSGSVDDVLHGLDLDQWTLWDNKVRGAYGMRVLIRDGLPKADADMYVQMQCYMKALNVTQCIITVVPHDLSIMKREIKSYKLDADPLIHRIILHADEETQTCAATRATELTAAKNLGVLPRREFNPMDKQHAVFPCGYCEWRTQCVVDDLTKEQLDITPLPKWEDTVDLEATVGAQD